MAEGRATAQRTSTAITLAGAPFRAVLAGSLIWLAIFVLTALGVLSFVAAQQKAHLREDVLEQVDLYRSVFQERGTDGLARFMRDTTTPAIARRRLLGLFAPDGTRLAGDIRKVPPFHWSSAEAGPSDEAADMTVFATVNGFDGATFAIEMKRDPLRPALVRVLGALLLGWIVGTGITLLIGYLYSSTVWTRLRIMADTLETVSRGDVEARVPKTAGRTQLDRVTRLVNRHLGRLQRLIETTRNTAAAMAHELRAPLTRASIALQEAYAHEHTPDEVKAHVEAAQEELHLLNRMFMTILRIGRIQTETDGSDFTPVGLGPLIGHMFETYEAVAEDSGRRLLLTSCEDATVMGDADMLQHLLANLLGNALQHTSEGTAIWLSLACDETTATITVADDGPGIPAERAAEALLPFRQIDVEASAEPVARSGSGLGLSLVKAMVDAHEGTLLLGDNEPGLKVEITLPLARGRRSSATDHAPGRGRD